jgi:hypothetical protein
MGMSKCCGLGGKAGNSELGEDEQKENTEGRSSPASAESQESDIETDEEDDCLRELPDEVLERIGRSRIFRTHDELFEALDEAGVEADDVPRRIVLVRGRPRELLSSDQKNSFMSECMLEFTLLWGRGGWGVCSATHNVHLFPGLARRSPDLSYWGYPRCQRGSYKLLNGDSIPDAVIQFCWKNSFGYEEEALNDIMTRGREQAQGPLSETRPRVGYLIKARFSKKRKLAEAEKGRDKTQDLEGLDIYRLVHGTTTADARSGMNPQAKHTRYTPGGPEVLIVLELEDLGIEGCFASLWCGPYTIKASNIFSDMDNYQKKRQARGLST